MVNLVERDVGWLVGGIGRRDDSSHYPALVSLILVDFAIFNALQDRGLCRSVDTPLYRVVFRPKSVSTPLNYGL